MPYGKVGVMMRRVLTTILAVFFLGQTAWAFWVWTPETKKWTNPKFAPKESPQEQLIFAKKYYETKDYTIALNEFKKLVRYYADAVEAPEAQYYAGLCLEELGKYNEAYLSYQKVIDKYPFSMRTDDVLQREYIVAQKLLDYKNKVVGIDFTAESLAIEIFRKIIDNSPYGKYAAASQYKIGLALKAKGYFMEATEEFQKVLDNYPESEWAEPAKFQIALCSSKSSLDAAYDQTLTQDAKEKFREFVRSHPEAELSLEAESKISELKDKEAEADYQVGEFYEKQGTLESALIYYHSVVKNFPASAWARASLEKIKILEKEQR